MGGSIMSTYYKFLLGLMGAAYFISPVDLIPDLLLPFLGWIDDAFIVGLIVYYLKNGRLPAFLSKDFMEKRSGKKGGTTFQKPPSFGRPKNQNPKQQKYASGSGNGFQQSERGKGGFGSTNSGNANNNQSYDSQNQYDQWNRSDSAASNAKKEKKKSPHEILGISANATPDEILAAYRKGVKAYHPDRVAHLGKDLQLLANKRFIEIKEAYTQLSKKAG